MIRCATALEERANATFHCLRLQMRFEIGQDGAIPLKMPLKSSGLSDECQGTTLVRGCGKTEKDGLIAMSQDRRG